MTEQRSVEPIIAPPMHPFLWGTPDEAHPLGEGTRGMLSSLLGIDADGAARPDLDDVELSEPMLSDGDRSALEAIVGAAAVSSERDQRLGRARGKSYLDLLEWRSGEVISAPDACVAPADEAQVLAVLEECAERGIAVVPFGGGTSVVGGLTPDRGGFSAVISLDLAAFDELEDLDEISGEATLGAGLTGPDAERLLGERGWSLGHFPQSFPYATIGGFAATRSSGQDSAGYGRFDDMVRALTVVTPTGVAVAGRAPASAAGPDLREVFLGSEGAFGVITKVRVRIHRAPEVVRHEAFTFPDFAAGTAGLREVAQTGAGPTVIRLSDEPETMVNLAGDTKGIGEMSLNPGCRCVAMFEGPAGAEADVDARMERTRDILLAHGATSEGPEPAEAWERGRFGAPVLRDAMLDAGALCETLETATQWSNVPGLHAAVGAAVTEALSPAAAFVLCHVSHVYDTGASLYFTVVSAQSDDPRGQWRAAKDAASRAIADAGATITHHHAVGVDHRAYLAEEIGDVGVAVLRGIKSAVDPAGIMNPGTLVP
ncbi:FAD-binding oxidoreductase [uncultured Corynebacterium sp.]|uniref:FAD-binding oxidoreductase n=1 Tax=uncultured Corynebacterium sp. TaxID=159447 RepID=UPI0025E0A0AE|nr:FAD-binding oxidoreductase [uncultured Corynebacterium sp.]